MRKWKEIKNFLTERLADEMMNSSTINLAAELKAVLCLPRLTRDCRKDPTPIRYGALLTYVE